MTHWIIFVALLGIGTLSSLATTLITFAMVGELNRTRGASPRISYLNISMPSVLKEYRSLHPKGIYPVALVVSLTLTGVLFVILVYLLLFGFAGEAPRSR